MPYLSRNLLARLGVLGLAILLLLVYLNTRVLVILNADGEARELRTHASTVAQALYEAGVALYVEDLVQPALETKLSPRLTISIKRAAPVQVEADGQTRLIRTQLLSPPAILASAGVPLAPEDEIWADGVLFQAGQTLPAPKAPHMLAVRRALTVTISDGPDAEAQFRTPARTVGEALWAAGYQLYRADQVSPTLDTPLAALAKITISRSHPVTVQADGQTLRTRTHSATVGEVLGEVGLALVGEDYAVPSADQPLPTAAAVRVVRVREETLTANAPIPFSSAYQAMADWEIDTVGQVQAGVPGVKQRLTRVRFEDGAEITRTVQAEFVAAKPTPRLIGYGTKIVVRTLDTPDGPIEYWRAYSMYATSYAAKFLGGSNHTASGLTLTKGVVAIDRRYIPFFTRMYVPGYGPAVAGDTGGGVKGRWIDLGFDDFNYEGWHQKVTVYFLTPVPPADQIVWIIPSTVP